MNSDNEQWIQDERDVLRENTAQAIHEHLERQDNLRAAYTRRWIWELFQNALDAAGAEGKVNIRISVSSELFTFEHRGAPFTRREILHLIFHGSTKRESAEHIGRYGTGFLTTHVLSRVLSVSGVLDGGQQFDFTLDRRGTTPTEIADRMNQARNDLLESLRPANEIGTWTRFAYPLDECSAVLVQEAVRDILNIGSFVIAFNRKIESVELCGAQAKCLQVIGEVPDQECSLVTIGNLSTGDDYATVCVAQTGAAQAAIMLRKLGDQFSVVQLADVPRFFVAFPLFGTESLALPFVLNLQGGKPTENRDGLFLGKENEAANNHNRDLCVEGFQAYRKLLASTITNGWGNRHLLAGFSVSPEFPWLDKTWLTGLAALTITDNLIASPVVLSSSEKYISPSHAVFPAAVPGEDADILQGLLLELIGPSVVDSSSYTAWIAILDGWRRLCPTGVPSGMTSAQLATRVADMKSLALLRTQLKNDIDSIEWLNRLLKDLISSGQNRVLDTVVMLPDQSGTFRLRSKLKRDNGISDELKDIGTLLNRDIRAGLLHIGVTESVQELMPNCVEENVLTELLMAVQPDQQNRPSTYESGNVKLAGWICRSRRADKVQNFPFLAQRGRAEKELSFVGLSRPLLGSPGAWSPSAQAYRSLFASEFVLSDAYTDEFGAEQWAWLENVGVCRLDPVTTEERTLTSTEVPSYVSDPDTLAEGDHSLSVRLVDILFLVTKDKGILDNTRSSKQKAALFLSFIFDHVLPTYSSYMSYLSSSCSCGLTHEVMRSAWMQPVKDRKWICESRTTAAQPTAQSLSKLLRASPELLPQLARPEVSLFFERLGISRTELVRNSLGRSPAELTQLDNAVVQLMNAADNDPTTVATIAEILTEDPELLRQFQQRKRAKERTRQNQRVGALVEDLFKSLVSNELLLLAGIRIVRRWIGRDFDIESDLIGEGGEQGFEFETGTKRLLVELKSTFGDSVSMTDTQAKLAVDRPDGFVVCVVPLLGENIDIDAVRLQARFVTDIGHLLRERVITVAELETLRQTATSSGGAINVEIENSSVRYRLLRELWEDRIGLNGFVDFIRAFFGFASERADLVEHAP